MPGYEVIVLSSPASSSEAVSWLASSWKLYTVGDDILVAEDNNVSKSFYTGFKA